jgi:hypothetical protein
MGCLHSRIRPNGDNRPLFCQAYNRRVRISRRGSLAASAVAVLAASWIVVWFMPAPEVCKSIDCGANFNEDALPDPLAFLNWQQLVVLVVGITIFVILLALALTRRRS